MAGFGGVSGALRLANASSATLFCGYCGSETRAVGRIGVCSRCEMPMEQDSRSFSEKNPELFSSLASIRGAIGKGDFDSAAKGYDDAFAKYNDPGFLYAESLVRIMDSNATIARIKYDRKGFMEENTSYRNKAAQLVSASKLLLAKAISICNNAIKAGVAPGSAYLLFLCYSKMGNARGAANAIGLIEKAGNSYLGKYARMAHAASVRDYKGLEASAEAMLASDSFSVNAFFYLALAELKKGDEKRAVQMIKEAKQVVESESMDRLLIEIERYGESLM